MTGVLFRFEVLDRKFREVLDRNGGGGREPRRWTVREDKSSGNVFVKEDGPHGQGKTDICCRRVESLE